MPLIELITEAGLVDRARLIMLEKPFGTDLASARALNASLHELLRRGAYLPHRPLPRQGGRAQHPRLPLRQRAVRADLEPRPHRPRADRRARDARARGPRRLLRVDRGLPRHGGHPPVPGPRVHGHGAAHRARPGRHQRARRTRSSARMLPLHPPTSCAVSTPAIATSRASRRTRDRDVRRAPVPDRQLALGRRAVLPAHRQAHGRGMPGSSRSPSGSRPRACSRPDPAWLRRARPPHLRPRRCVGSLSLSFYGKRPGPGHEARQAQPAVRPARDRPDRRRASRPTSGSSTTP